MQYIPGEEAHTAQLLQYVKKPKTYEFIKKITTKCLYVRYNPEQPS
jgi:hypothetical protein